MNKKSKKKVVMIFGSFDFLHAGHFHFFNFAKSKGDKVVAVVARDENIAKIKGSQPFHSEDDRKKMLSQIKCIDKVYLGDTSDVYKIIKKVKPDIIALGYDQNVFVDDLAMFIKDNKLITKIVRGKSYKADIYKSSKIKKYLSTLI